MNIYNYDSNFNIIKEIEYTEWNTDFIDDRIWKVCKEAESNYNQNQKTVKEIQKIKNFDLLYKDNKKSIDKNKHDDNIKINNEFDYKYVDISGVKIPKDQQNEKIKKVDDDSSYLDLESHKELLQSNGMDKVKQSNNKLPYNKLEHKHRSMKKCVACELKKK
jgi:hypothetical protein